jgi:hypothetical protein
VLLAEGYQRLDAAGRRRLRRLVGSGSYPAVGEIRVLLEESGARQAVEERIKGLGKQAVEALSSGVPVDAGVRESLVGLVAVVTDG